MGQRGDEAQCARVGNGGNEFRATDPLHTALGDRVLDACCGTGDLAIADAEAILMTEKDALKCETFADERCWYLPVRVHIDPALVSRVEEALRGSQAA